MPTDSADKSDPSLEAQVLWFKYRRQLAILLVLLLLALAAITLYRIYRERRERQAASLFAPAKSAAEYQNIINDYGDTAAAAAAFLLFADAQRKERKFVEANATLQTFIDKFPQHELITTAQMALAANLESAGKQDEALATYQRIVSMNPGNFNAPFALLAQVHILQAKNRTDDARHLCETIMTQYQNSSAAFEATRLLRALKPTSAAAAIPGPTLSPASTVPMPKP